MASITPDTMEVTEARRWLKDGFLPAAGGMADQSETFILALQVIDGIVAECQARDREEDERKRKHGR